MNELTKRRPLEESFLHQSLEEQALDAKDCTWWSVYDSCKGQPRQR